MLEEYNSDDEKYKDDDSDSEGGNDTDDHITKVAIEHHQWKSNCFFSFRIIAQPL